MKQDQTICLFSFDDFIIRPINIADAENYFSFINSNRDRITKYFPKTASASVNKQSTIKHIAERIDLMTKNEFITLVIVNKSTKKIIGSVFLKNIDWNVQKGELGFFIDKSVEGMGVMSRCLAVIIDYFFHTINLNKLFMRIAEDNISSRRVAEKNNFLIEGTLRNDFKTFEGVLIDVVYYGRLRSQ
jgi:RimJ/RimL family protein N-acetyltransferase